MLLGGVKGGALATDRWVGALQGVMAKPLAVGTLGVLVEAKLRVRYNHSKRKNHTKFFAKLFSHWLKTFFSGFTPSFTEKEVYHHFYYVFLWQQRKEKDYLQP